MKEMHAAILIVASSVKSSCSSLTKREMATLSLVTSRPGLNQSGQQLCWQYRDKNKFPMRSIARSRSFSETKSRADETQIGPVGAGKLAASGKLYITSFTDRAKHFQLKNDGRKLFYKCVANNRCATSGKLPNNLQRTLQFGAISCVIVCGQRSVWAKTLTNTKRLVMNQVWQRWTFLQRTKSVRGKIGEHSDGQELHWWMNMSDH